MRVIAGSSGGLRLYVPKTDIRPTMDRVKAAIFSSLGERVIGARVLDLFAGTGALGIEALSRGAASVMFVESDRQAIVAIERNLAQTGLSGRLRNQRLDFLQHTSTAESHELSSPPAYASRVGAFFSKLLSATIVCPPAYRTKNLRSREKTANVCREEFLGSYPAQNLRRDEPSPATQAGNDSLPLQPCSSPPLLVFLPATS